MKMKFRTYVILHHLGLVTEESEERLSQAPCPRKVHGKAIPETLNSLKMGQLVDIMSLDPGNEIEAVRVISGIDPRSLDDEPATAVVGLVNFIQSELRRISDMFKQLKPHYSSQERQAGAEELDFGIFGTIDWYAKRMGITNHDDVLGVPWLHVWQCAKIDKEHNEYQQRYQDIIIKNSKP